MTYRYYCVILKYNDFLYTIKSYRGLCMIKFVINKNDSGQRIDKFITKALPEMPKNLMYKLFRKKDIKLNGKRCDISTYLSENDEVTIYYNTASVLAAKDMTFLNSALQLNIVYEDDNVIIVNKPTGLTVHCDNEHESDTLINRIKHYLYKNGGYDPETEASFSPALCSRLDKNTCGLVTAAKNAQSLRLINEAIRCGNVTKLYKCAVIGKPPHDKEVLTAYHFKEAKGNIVHVYDQCKEGSKPIKTGYNLLASKNGISLLEITLYTGRTHQIRAHLAHVGLPVLGDGKYGIISENRRYNIFHQALCAYKLVFRFPENSELYYLNDIDLTIPYTEIEKIFV